MAQGIVGHDYRVDDASQDEHGGHREDDRFPCAGGSSPHESRLRGNQRHVSAGLAAEPTSHHDHTLTTIQPSILPAMAVVGAASCILVCWLRAFGGGPCAGGMPPWKYMANRALTLADPRNILLVRHKLSEIKPRYRASHVLSSNACRWRQTPTIAFSTISSRARTLARLRLGEVD